MNKCSVRGAGAQILSLYTNRAAIRHVSGTSETAMASVSRVEISHLCKAAVILLLKKNYLQAWLNLLPAAKPLPLLGRIPRTASCSMMQPKLHISISICAWRKQTNMHSQEQAA